jgi:2-polyprenyl-3-methyl-5-hydroxy-6-metoxy-1,4-benzoquinol methylase
VTRSELERNSANARALAANADAAVRTASYYDRLWSELDDVPDEDDRIRLDFIVFALGRLALPHLPSILDLGCGSGWMTPALSAWGTVTGVDFSPLAIRRARERYGGYATFHQAAPESPTLGLSGRFDVVVCSDVIEHVPEPRALIRQAAGFLEDGGWCLLSTPNGTVWPEYRRLFEGRMQPIENWLTPARLSQLLTEAGFAIHLHEGRATPALRLGASPLLQHPMVKRAFSAVGLARWYGRRVLPSALYQVVIARNVRG